MILSATCMFSKFGYITRNVIIFMFSGEKNCVIIKKTVFGISAIKTIHLEWNMTSLIWTFSFFLWENSLGSFDWEAGATFLDNLENILSVLFFMASVDKVLHKFDVPLWHVIFYLNKRHLFTELAVLQSRDTFWAIIKRLWTALYPLA